MKSVLITFLLLLLLGCQQSPSGRDIQIRLSRIHETKDIPISELAKSYCNFTIPKECNPSDIRTISANNDMALVTFFRDSNGCLLKNFRDSSFRWIKSEEFNFPDHGLELFYTMIDPTGDEIFFTVSGLDYFGTYNVLNGEKSVIFAENVLHDKIAYFIGKDTLLLWQNIDMLPGSPDNFYLGIFKLGRLNVTRCQDFTLPKIYYDSGQNLINIVYVPPGNQSNKYEQMLESRVFRSKESADRYKDFTLTRRSCKSDTVSISDVTYYHVKLIQEKFLILDITKDGNSKYIYYDKATGKGFYIRDILLSPNPLDKIAFDSYLRIDDNNTIFYLEPNTEKDSSDHEIIMLSF